MNSIVLKNRTSTYINNLSNKIKKNITRKSISYAPSVNKLLVSLKSIKRTTMHHCNTVKAFKLQEPLNIAITKHRCARYDTLTAKKVLLNKLRANKHIIISKIIPPKQIDGNCWFNVMFVCFFISDKGRKFFHFFRQLMIQGKDVLGKPIPEGLKDAFALLNYGVELSISGSKYAVNVDTNYIILDIYDNIPNEYKTNVPDEGDAGNPIFYYNAIMQYLNNNSVSILEHRITQDWNTTLTTRITSMPKIPHIIILSGYQPITNKLITFTIGNFKYALDSAAIINDTSKTSDAHFTATLTCEHKEMAFDGLSFHRIIPLNWKKNLNKNVYWQFEGSENKDGPLLWNFQTCYQQLIYYRIK
jgi:hypothetical protein